MPRFVDAIRATSRTHVSARKNAGSTGRRAAVAAIFRFHPSTGEEEVLFIRRSVNPKDPWSGNVALPGGRQDADDNGDDEATAIRETREEVGLDITGAEWERLGRIVDDRMIQSRGKPLAVSMFGFAAKSDACIPSQLTLQPSEVAHAWWVGTKYLDANNLDWRIVELTEIAGALRKRPFARRILGWLKLESISFAAIALPPPPPADATTGAPATQPLPSNHPQRSQYELWGLTLAFVSDVLRKRAVGQPLVGPGAPAEFVEAYTSSNQSFVARNTFRLMVRVTIRPLPRPFREFRLSVAAAVPRAARRNTRGSTACVKRPPRYSAPAWHVSQRSWR